MKGLYRGFCRNENGTETIVLNGEKINGEWVQGFLATECHIIDDTDSFTYFGSGGMDGFAKIVIPETVCEAVRGLTDRNGKQVFEGDIIKHYHDSRFPEAYSKGEVFYCKNYLRWKRSSENVDCCLNLDCDYEVIGTIFDEQFADGV